MYKHAHGAPARLAQFTCAVPEHLASAAHAARRRIRAASPRPSCSPRVPLLKLGLAKPTLFVSGVTGSTGSGRKPVEGTHHPQRHSDLYAYNALAHRHAPEVTACAQAASGVEAHFAFVPHSGPFARGIHVTVQAAAREARHDSASCSRHFAEFYAHSPFVAVSAARAAHQGRGRQQLRAPLAWPATASTVAVMCVLDNLNKGAAGGAVQWMNRLLGLPETAGLMAPAAGWT